jgi:hypothetical protein
VAVVLVLDDVACDAHAQSGALSDGFCGEEDKWNLPFPSSS